MDNVVAIAGGMKGYHSIALKSDGTVVAWGNDDSGQSSGVPDDLNALVYIFPTTYVPDDNFEQALIDLGYDDVLDDYVLTENISGVTDLEVNNKGISDLTGVEDFTALTYLNCRDNNLTELDLSANTALTILRCTNNQITSLDVSANIFLTWINCDHNQLTILDVSANIGLTFLDCGGNNLEALDVSNNTALESLTVDSNQLTELDVSNNTAITTLNCI